MPQWDPPFKYRNSTITRKMHMHYRCTYFTNSSIAQKPHHIFMCFGCKKAYFVHFITILFPFRLNDKCYVMIMLLKYCAMKLFYQKANNTKDFWLMEVILHKAIISSDWAWP